ncbi:hypothetical protein [Modicisalibacter ilicicola]|uniref:hypothetical protein n=1 Tax=Modicisalibacter ilicicola TaxID=480814 RepID=UPI001114DC12|nr:hypothetical protein [Halomonas ilicicola]
MDPIKLIIGLGGVACGISGTALLLIASLIALFKLDEADHYYGAGRLGGERLFLKGLPFSLWRMTEYGLITLLSHNRLVKRFYGEELMMISARNPPRKLNIIIKYLYSSWLLLVIMAVLAGISLGVFF